MQHIIFQIGLLRSELQMNNQLTNFLYICLIGIIISKLAYNIKTQSALFHKYFFYFWVPLFYNNKTYLFLPDIYRFAILHTFYIHVDFYYIPCPLLCCQCPLLIWHIWPLASDFKTNK